jgi:cytochrome P450
LRQAIVYWTDYGAVCAVSLLLARLACLKTNADVKSNLHNIRYIAPHAVGSVMLNEPATYRLRGLVLQAFTSRRIAN